MASLFSLIFFATLVGFFVARRRDKKTTGKITKNTWYLLLISIVTLLIAGALSPKPTKTNTTNEKTTVSSSSSSSTSSSSQSSDFDFSKVDAGMTMDQVIQAIGKQPTDKDDNTLYYGKEDIDFSNGVLIGSSIKSIQDKVDDKFKNDASQASKKKNDAENLKSYAQYFGNLPVENIQSKPYAYKSSKIDNGMRYLYKVKDNSFLVRIDTNDGYTNVYTYDGNSDEKLGEDLYTGRTIFNNPEKKNYYYVGG